MANKLKITVSALRREKSANYTRDEKHLLLDKVTPFFEIIENKKTDTVTVEAKTRAWVQVTSNYNTANPRGTRKINQLKNLYENLKKRVKKDILAYKEEFRQTGMHSAKGKIDEVAWRLIKLLPRLRILYTSPDPVSYINAIYNENTNTTHNEITKQHCTLTADSLDRTSTDTNADEIQLNIKEEILDEAIDLEDLPETISTEDNTLSNTEDQISQVEDNAITITSFTKQTDATQTEELLEMEKEVKRKEIDKLNLEIQIKQLEMEYMRSKLREQELQVKFKEMEYQIKCKEFIK